MRSSKDTANAPDIFAATREELEFLRRQFEAMMREKRTEAENFKEDSLWQLNSMSDRTVEIAREEALEVDVLLARDREKVDSELAEWRTRLHGRIHDEEFLGRLAVEAVEALLPQDSYAAGVLDDSEGGTS
jgi:hypothetical protein